MRYILLLTRGRRAAAYTYSRLKQRQIDLGLFPGWQILGTLCLISVAMAVSAIEHTPPLRRGKACSTLRTVPETRPQAGFLPSSRVRFFAGQRRAATRGLWGAGGDHCQGVP